MASSSRSEKRCHYEVLGINKESTADEIRSSYRRLALLRHPDKLMKAGGLSEAEATTQFQELVHAYEVLSDPKERAWYDSHRSQILFADHGSAGGSKSGGMPGGSVPDLFAFFSANVYSGYSDTGKGFFKVYFDVFNSVYLNEIKFARMLGLGLDSVREAPIMGNLESPYAQVTAFYNYWLGFCTVMDFCWVDEYTVMAGPNRKTRRVMEEVNKKLRKNAKKEYNETVRRLAEFVKKRDKRVIDMMVKKNAEMEKKKQEERERKKKMEREKMERAMNYEEPDWAKAQDGEEEEAGFNVLEDNDDNDAKRKNEQLYCIVCSKKFKSEKQWKNHEQSKKHKEKLAELRESFTDYEEKEEINEPLEPPESVEQLHEKFQEGLNMDDEEESEGKDVEDEVVGEADETDEEYFVAEEDLERSSESADEDVDDEMSLLKKMVSGKKNKRKNVVSRKEDEVQIEIESDSELDNQKRTGRNRKGKKERNKCNGENDMTDEASKVQTPGDDDNTDETVNATDTASGAFEDSQKVEADLMEYNNRKSTGRRRRSKKCKDKDNIGWLTEKNREADDTQDGNGDGDMEGSQSEAVEDRSEYIDRPQGYKKAPRSKKSTRGMKTKGTSKRNSGNECDRCGEEFESRTKLHKHLADSGHATVKSR